VKFYENVFVKKFPQILGVKSKNPGGGDRGPIILSKYYFMRNPRIFEGDFYLLLGP
jgi:hypothetical protein